MIYIEYYRCPTSWNAPTIIRIEWKELPQYLKLGGMGFDRISFTDHAKRMGHTGSQGTSINCVYEEVGDEKRIYYKDRGYGDPHFSEALKAELKEVKEVLV